MPPTTREARVLRCLTLALLLGAAPAAARVPEPLPMQLAPLAAKLAAALSPAHRTGASAR